MVFGSDRTITGKWRKLCYIISLCVCSVQQLSWPMIPFLIQIPFVERVWVWPVVWLHSKKEYPSHSAAAAVIYKSIYLCKIWIISLLKNCLTSVRARNSMLSRPFAADECFSSISYFIFLYTQFTVKKLNVGHKKKNTDTGYLLISMHN